MNTLAQNKALYRKWAAAYYAGTPIATDVEFDALEARILKQDPTFEGVKKTNGEKIGKKQEAKLPVPMPSLAKMQSGSPKIDQVVNGLSDYATQAVISHKLDGSSIEAVYQDGELSGVITRGDGITGKDVTHFAPYFKHLPQRINHKGEFVIRLEAILRLDDYEQSWSGAFDSARALASSLLNRQDVHPAFDDLHTVALRVLKPQFALADGLEYARKLGFEVVKHRVDRVEGEGWDEYLCELLNTARTSSHYELDGLVLFSNAAKLPAPTDERPAYAKAFKLNDEETAPETVIESISWKVSPFGVVVPTANIRPIKFGNVTVSRASLHNAGWAQDRGAGVGAKVKVLRSGEIIPKIVAVVKPATLKLPSFKAVGGGYDWQGPALVLTDPDSHPAIEVGKMTRLFKVLGLDGFGGALAAKLVDAGYERKHLLMLTPENFRALDGVKDSAAKYVSELRRVVKEGIDVCDLMVASGVFPRGVGRRKLNALYQKHPEMFQGPLSADSKHALRDMGVLGKDFAEGYPKFRQWVKDCGIDPRVIRMPEAPEEAAEGPLTGQFGTWTGYRDSQEEAFFRQGGGVVVPFGSKTNVLFTTAHGKKSSKVDKARERGILIVTEFKPWVNSVVGE
jgi:DNA ligase (NAD+)